MVTKFYSIYFVYITLFLIRINWLYFNLLQICPHKSFWTLLFHAEKNRVKLTILYTGKTRFYVIKLSFSQ